MTGDTRLVDRIQPNKSIARCKTRYRAREIIHQTISTAAVTATAHETQREAPASNKGCAGCAGSAWSAWSAWSAAPPHGAASPLHFLLSTPHVLPTSPRVSPRYYHVPHVPQLVTTTATQVVGPSCHAAPPTPPTPLNAIKADPQENHATNSCLHKDYNLIWQLLQVGVLLCQRLDSVSYGYGFTQSIYLSYIPNMAYG